MTKRSEVSELMEDINTFRNQFRARLLDIDTLTRIADADEDSVLAGAIAPADRSRIQEWRDTSAGKLQFVIEAGIIFELKQQDPYLLPEFTPQVFRNAHELARNLLGQLVEPEDI